MKPLIFFVHVPKTAGSTVNAALKRHSANGQDHCEQLVPDKAAFAEAANTLDWLSGHVALPTAKGLLAEATDRPVRFFTCLRDPTEQIASHYNWLIEIYHRGGDFYENHPPHIKAISERLLAKSETVYQIIDNLAEYRGLFLNCQSRYVPESRLSGLELVGYSGNLDALLSAMTGDHRAVDARVNSSPYRFDATLFDTPMMTAFLQEEHTADHHLWWEAVWRKNAA